MNEETIRELNEAAAEKAREHKEQSRLAEIIEREKRELSKNIKTPIFNYKPQILKYFTN